MATITSTNDSASSANNNTHLPRCKTIAERLAEQGQAFFEGPSNLSDRDVRKKNVYNATVDSADD